MTTSIFMKPGVVTRGLGCRPNQMHALPCPFPYAHVTGSSRYYPAAYYEPLFEVMADARQQPNFNFLRTAWGFWAKGGNKLLDDVRQAFEKEVKRRHGLKRPLKHTSIAKLMGVSVWTVSHWESDDVLERKGKSITGAEFLKIVKWYVPHH